MVVSFIRASDAAAHSADDAPFLATVTGALAGAGAEDVAAAEGAVDAVGAAAEADGFTPVVLGAAGVAVGAEHPARRVAATRPAANRFFMAILRSGTLIVRRRRDASDAAADVPSAVTPS
jgi:hypothetical protein